MKATRMYNMRTNTTLVNLTVDEIVVGRSSKKNGLSEAVICMTLCQNNVEPTSVFGIEELMGISERLSTL